MDITALPAAITSLKVATGLVKEMLKTANAIEAQGKVIELQTALLDVLNNALSATTVQYELRDQVRALKEQLKAFNDWDEQGQRYTLVCPWGDAAQVYALRKASSAGEVAHFLCTNCFHERHRVILNQVATGGRSASFRYVSLVCPSCKASIDTSLVSIGTPKYAEEYAGQ